MHNGTTNILFAGGGTGGHLFPALAIAEEIRKLEPGAQFLFAGTKGKIEADVVPRRGFAFAPIWISGFHRGLRIQNLLFPLKVVVALVQSFFLIKRFRPDAAVGTGGYVCGPVLYVASLLGIPTVIHESNSYPGITTRMLSGRATKVFVAFEVARQWLKRGDNIELLGTPTRDSLGTVSRAEARKFFGLDETKRTVLIFGGSLGASSFNRAMPKIAEELSNSGIQFIWQTGQKDYQAIQKTMEGKSIGWIGPFIDRMECAYAAADVVVSRSGATTLAELTRVGKAAILVPFPYSAADHQKMNAESMAKAGAAIVVRDHEIEPRLAKEILELLSNQSGIDSMAKASKGLGRPGAGRAIAEGILRLAHGQ